MGTLTAVRSTKIRSTTWARPAAAPTLRVAYVMHRHPSEPHAFLVSEMLELQRRGVEVIVIVGRGSGEPGSPSCIHRPGLDPAAVAEILRSSRATHVHAADSASAETARKASAWAGLPYSFRADAADTAGHDVDATSLVRNLSEAAFVVTGTDRSRQALQRLLDENNAPGRVVRVYDGVDVGQLRPPGQVRPSMVVAVGRLVEQNGFADLLRALAMLRDAGHAVPALIIGDGPERDELQAMRGTLRLRSLVQMPGDCHDDVIVNHLRGARVLVLPWRASRDRDGDAIPTVMLQAMAMGTPVVSTAVDAVPEIIEDGSSGLLVGQHDPAALAAAIRLVLDDPQRSRELAQRARARAVKTFSLSANVAALHDLLAETQRL